jgi:hypothetical protein
MATATAWGAKHEQRFHFARREEDPLPILVGADRRAVVDTLVQRFDDIGAGAGRVLSPA